MGKTIINVAITMSDDEWDRFDKKYDTDTMNALNRLEDAASDGILQNLGFLVNTKVTKIE